MTFRMLTLGKSPICINRCNSLSYGAKKQFKCEICNAEFGQKRDLNKHVATIHPGKSNSNVTFVMLTLNKIHVATVDEAKKNRNSNVPFITLQ